MVESEIPPNPKDGEALGKHLGSTGEAPGKHPGSQEGKGKEYRKGKDYISLSDSPNPPPLVQVWNDMAIKSEGVFPVVKGMARARADKCRARLAELPLEDWKTALEKIRGSPFCRGEIPDREGKTWRATFDWLIKNDQNVLKVLEGNYDERRQNNFGNGAAPTDGKYAHLSGAPPSRD